MALMNKDEVIQILKILAESNLDELHLEMKDLKLVARKYAKVESDRRMESASEALAQAPVTEKKPEPPADEKKNIPASFPSPKPAPGEAAVPPEEEGLTAIRAPMLGTFYRAPKPEAAPFVEVGQFVTEEDVVCIIEVMKLFNTVKSGLRGRVVKICAENAQLVEYKQTLFLIEEIPEEKSEGGQAS